MAERLTENECYRLFREYDTPDRVIAHCLEVSRCAYLIACELNKNGYQLDAELVRIAALIHDLMRTDDKHDEAAGEVLMSLGYEQEAEIVRDHMSYRFNDLPVVTEHDVVCLSDRIVKEHEYAGIDDRVEYLINKAPENIERKEHLLYWKEKVREYIHGIEDIIGISFDELLAPDMEQLLSRVEKPARYTGHEVNEIVKDVDDHTLRMAFAFPDLYEIGMSYLGLQILYDVVNKRDGLYMERVFEPAPDMCAMMRKTGRKLFTLETGTQVKDMDVLGFTLQYEMSYTDILDMLDLSDIPLYARDRDDRYPLVIAGGPCAFAPEPLADFIDVFLIGDGELLLPSFLEKLRASKENAVSKTDFLRSVCSDEGVYVPAFYEPVYNDDETVKEYRKVYENAPDVIEKVLVKDLDSAPFPVNNIIPNVEAVHDRAAVESFRGCTRGCRFCQAGMLYRPIRERKRDTIIDLARKQIENTGHDELSLLSLSTSDHSDFEGMATELMDLCSKSDVSLSLPSLRLDSFSFKVLNEIQKYKKSGLTFAVEAGTQRLRDSINKGITEEDVFSAIEQAIELGWRHVKLYFMIGLPGETDEDLDGIVKITKDILAIHKRSGNGGFFNVTVSCSNFVPKPFTPFQWVPQDSMDELDRKREYLRQRLKIKGVKFQCHDSFVSKVEAVLARGDRRCSELLAAAHEAGCVLDGWSDLFDKEKWSTVLDNWSMDYRFFSDRERAADEYLSWDMIDPYVTKKYLLSEYRKSTECRTTRDCRKGCNGCGLTRVIKCFGEVENE
ncbi:MAG: TIGR03960 family B12-binding radical SAM protein [Eubacterium sp.]|nr:TIGR03960 family B12-binding radical SAM protein [Eubacterium sp.]